MSTFGQSFGIAANTRVEMETFLEFMKWFGYTL